MQTASADDSTTDPVDFWFSFEDLNNDNNTVRARLYTASGRDGRKAALKCELPDPAPAFIDTSVGTNTDGSSNTFWQTSIDGNNFSLWDSKEALEGIIAGNRQRFIFHFDAFDRDGNYVDIGCCQLFEENDDDLIAEDYDDTYGPAGLTVTPALFTSVGTKYCMLQQAPTAPAGDVAVADVLVASTSTASTGTTDHANSVIASLDPVATAVPQLQSIATVTTGTGYCGGLDLVYVTDTDVDVYNTGLGSTVAAATQLTGGLKIKHVREMYSSPDSNNSNYLALKIVIEDTVDQSTTTLTCGNFQDTDALRTNMVCNPYSSVLGFSATTADNGALTSMTINHAPLFGGVSVA